MRKVQEKIKNDPVTPDVNIRPRCHYNRHVYGQIVLHSVHHNRRHNFRVLVYNKLNIKVKMLFSSAAKELHHVNNIAINT